GGQITLRSAAGAGESLHSRPRILRRLSQGLLSQKQVDARGFGEGGWVLRAIRRKRPKFCAGLCGVSRDLALSTVFRGRATARRARESEECGAKGCGAG